MNAKKPDSTLLRIELLQSFDDMIKALSTFCSALRGDTRLPIWVSRTEQEMSDNLNVRDKAIMLFQALWYEDGQDGRETLTCPGLIGASPETMTAAQNCNRSKDAFKAAVLALKKLRKPQVDALLTDLHARNAEIALTMRRMGTARLNLKQAYRHIPLLDTRPIKIGFTWSKQGRTIQRTSVAEARRLLERRKDSLQTRTELERLREVPETEMLARVRSVCPHLRANIVTRNKDELIERRLMQAPLPILLPLQADDALPDFIPIPPEPTGAVRLKRSDVRIEEEPFLPLIRIHRYQSIYR